MHECSCEFLVVPVGAILHSEGLSLLYFNYTGCLDSIYLRVFSRRPVEVNEAFCSFPHRFGLLISP